MHRCALPLEFEAAASTACYSSARPLPLANAVATPGHIPCTWLPSAPSHWPWQSAEFAHHRASRPRSQRHVYGQNGTSASPSKMCGAQVTPLGQCRTAGKRVAYPPFQAIAWPALLATSHASSMVPARGRLAPLVPPARIRRAEFMDQANSIAVYTTLPVRASHARCSPVGRPIQRLPTPDDAGPAVLDHGPLFAARAAGYTQPIH